MIGGNNPSSFEMKTIHRRREILMSARVVEGNAPVTESLK
jgi:hypothetical protein